MMIKRIIGRDRAKISDADEHWLDLDSLAEVEVTSEEIARPIESALVLRPQSELGWEASEPGLHTVRILFDRPQPIKVLYLEFQEVKSARTQEFVLRWSSGGKSYREIVRQQYNFSQPNTTTEREHYDVDLDSVTHLELTIIPDISGGLARASLMQFRIK